MILVVATVKIDERTMAETFSSCDMAGAGIIFSRLEERKEKNEQSNTVEIRLMNVKERDNTLVRK